VFRNEIVEVGNLVKELKIRVWSWIIMKEISIDKYAFKDWE